MQKKLTLHLFFFILLLIFSWFLFQTGLSNAFILDDVPNLKGLAQLSGDSSFFQTLQFIFHNTHINSGRPVSFFIFSLQASDWPNPIPFKQFNIGLHLFNGILVFWLCHRIITHAIGKPEPIMALGVASFWILTPIQIDTVQYIIQRMAMLATTFTLLGLITFTYARTILTHKIKAFFLLYFVFGSCLILAVFSKENGLLLTALIILLELGLFRNEQRPAFFKVWFGLAIILPLILFVLLLVYQFDKYFLYTYKGFNALERLWTQQAIIVHYLSSILAPSTNKLTLFYDDFTIARSLLSSPYTLLFLILNISLILTGFFSLKRWPLFGIGILFFYANHLMESTFLPLELYFEHRNYLAVLGISLCLFSGVYYFNQLVKNRNIKYLVYSIPVILLLVSVWVNFQQNLVWSKPLYQAHKWYQDHPLSQRAHGYYGLQLNHVGLHKKAIHLYRSTLDDFPNDPTKPLLWLEFTCNPEVRPGPPSEELLKRAHNGSHYKETIAILNDFVEAFEAQRCPGVQRGYFLDIVEAFLNNVGYSGTKDKLNLLVIQYRMHQLDSNYYLAAKSLEQAMLIDKYRPDFMSGLSEKYIYLNQPQKAQKLMKELKNFCSKHPIKCANSKNNLKILDQLYNLYFKS